VIILRSRDEIQKLGTSNRLVAKVLQELRERAKAGVTTLELDTFAEDMMHKMGGIPAFKGYRGFPNTLCTSINEEVVHGIPSHRRLKEGDVLSIDTGVLYDGYYGDAAISVGVGRVGAEAARLLEVTERALYLGIEQAREGNHLSDISYAIQSCAEAAGLSVVREYVGHGIGARLHEEPQVPNYGPPGRGPLLKNGMVLAIEPMVNVGGSEVETLADGWTVVTVDRSLSAHFEHTIAIVDGEAVILS